MSSKNLGILITVVSAIGFGSVAVLAKFAYSSGAGISELLTIRFVIAAIIMWLITFLRKKPYRVTIKNLILLSIVGAVGYAGVSTLFFYAVQQISASVSGLLLYLYPSIVVVMAVLLKIEKWSRLKFIIICMTMAGTILILGTPDKAQNLSGIVAVLLAALVYAFYTLGVNYLVKQIDPFITSTYTISSCALVYLLISLLRGSNFLNLTMNAWWVAIVIALFSTVIAMSGYYYGIKLIGPGNAAVVSTVEPLSTVVFSAIFLGERLTFLQLLGAALLIVGIILLQKGMETPVVIEQQNSAAS